MAYAYTKFTTYSKLFCVNDFQFYFKVESVVRVCLFLVEVEAFMLFFTSLYRNTPPCQKPDRESKRRCALVLQ
jgi:hypothetical protein